MFLCTSVFLHCNSSTGCDLFEPVEHIVKVDRRDERLYLSFVKYSPYNKELATPWSSPQLLILTFYKDAKWLTKKIRPNFKGWTSNLKISLHILCIIYDTTRGEMGGGGGGYDCTRHFSRVRAKQLCCWIPMLLEATSPNSEGTKYVHQVQFQPEFKDYC